MIDIEDLVPPVPPARSRGLYRCRAHPNQAVTWRGRGCPACPPRNQSKAERRAKRKTVEAAEQIEWTQ
jgi:hypothetical protein